MASATQIKVKSTNAVTEKTTTKSLGYIGNFVDSDTTAVATAVDAAARAFIGMSTDGYSDSLIVETSSVNEILA